MTNALSRRLGKLEGGHDWEFADVPAMNDADLMAKLVELAESRPHRVAALIAHMTYDQLKRFEALLLELSEREGA